MTRLRLLPVTLLLLAVAWLGAGAAQAQIFSKTYQFRAAVNLEVGEITSGIRLDSVRFELPSTINGRSSRVAGQVRAFVSLSNVAEDARRAGVAVALFDDAGRLVGVASGGASVLSIKSGRQRTYTLVFDHVNAEAFRAKTFQISVEPR